MGHGHEDVRGTGHELARGGVRRAGGAVPPPSPHVMGPGCCCLAYDTGTRPLWPWVGVRGHGSGLEAGPNTGAPPGCCVESRAQPDNVVQSSYGSRMPNAVPHRQTPSLQTPTGNGSPWTANPVALPPRGASRRAWRALPVVAAR